jgi:hypothetical protein
MSEPGAQEPQDLGHQLRDLAKSQVAPADGLGRLRDRLNASIPGLVPSQPTPPQPQVPADHPAKPVASGLASAGAGKLLFAICGFAVGAAAGAIGMHEIDASRSAPAAPAAMGVPEVSARTANTHVVAAPSGTASSAMVVVPQVTKSAAHGSSTAPSTVTAVASGASNAERLLVDEARAAYARGARAEALDALVRHGRLYPNGGLVEEREALAVRILVDAGRSEEARARGERFLAKYPRSLMVPAVQAALESIP